jgi:hypothetical protein
MFDADDAKTTFELIGQSPHVWLSSATQLKRAADLVREELKKILSVYPRGRARYEDLVLFNSYMLLAGLALENLTKGILIGRNPNIVSRVNLDLKLLGNSKGGHDLSKLAQQAATNLSPIEIDLIDRLVAFVVWAGKYPIHLRANETNHPTFKTTDPELIDKVFEKFATILKDANPNPTVGFA